VHPGVPSHPVAETHRNLQNPGPAEQAEEIQAEDPALLQETPSSRQWQSERVPEVSKTQRPRTQVEKCKN